MSGATGGEFDNCRHIFDKVFISATREICIQMARFVSSRHGDRLISVRIRVNTTICIMVKCTSTVQDNTTIKRRQHRTTE